MFIKDAAPIILKLLDYSGVINLGGPAQSVYEFAKNENSEVLPLSRAEVADVMIAPDTSMDTSKLKSILNELS